MLNPHECISYYKKIISAIDSQEFDLMMTLLAELKKKLDCRFLLLEQENEFITYCQSLTRDREYSELRILIAGKIENYTDVTRENAHILELSSYRMVINE